MSWKLALGIACAPVYGPFVLMATYALLFVSCSHCKSTAWYLLPWAPGLLPVEAGRRLLNLPRDPDALWFAVAFIASLGMVAAVAALIRLSRRLGYLAMIVAVALCGFFAIGMLAMIRS